MSGGANIVEQYAGADVPARIELLIKYYPNFIRLVEGYEQSLSFIIKEEKAYARKSVMGDLGVRVQTSGTGDPTAKAAIENVMRSNQFALEFTFSFDHQVFSYHIPSPPHK